MEKKYEKESHMIFSAIAPRLDKMTICVRDGKYNDASATAFMVGLLRDIDKVMVKLKYERKNSKTTKEN